MKSLDPLSSFCLCVIHRVVVFIILLLLPLICFVKKVFFASNSRKDFILLEIGF